MTQADAGNTGYRKVVILVLLFVAALFLLIQGIYKAPNSESTVSLEMETKQNLDEVLNQKGKKFSYKFHFLVSRDDLWERIEKMKIKIRSPLLDEVLDSFSAGTRLLAHGRRNQNMLQLGRAIHKLSFSVETLPTFDTFYNLGYAYFEFGDYEEALDKFNKALKYETDHPGVYAGIGVSLINLGFVEKGLDKLHIGLAIADSIKDKAWKGEILGQLGNIYKLKKADQIAQVCLQEAIIKAYEAGYIEGAVDSLCSYSELMISDRRGKVNLGNPRTSYKQQEVFKGTGSGFKKAGHYLSIALDLAQKHKYQVGVGKSAMSLAVLYQSKGRLDAALDFYQQALAAYMDIENSLSQARIFNRIARIHKQRGDLKQALKYYQESLLMHRHINHREGKSSDMGNIGMIYYLKGDLALALKYYQGALVVHEEIGDLQKKSIALGNIGLIYLDKQDAEQALVYLRNALVIDRRISFREGEALHLSHIGKAYAAKDSLKMALRFFQDSQKLYREIGNPSGEARQLSNLARYYLSLNDSGKALKYHLDSLAAYREVGNIEGEASQMSRIGLLYREMGEMDKAIKYLNESLEIYESAHKQGHRKFASLKHQDLSRQMLIQNLKDQDL